MTPSEAELRKLYCEDRLSTREIGKRYDVAHITIRRWLTKFDIPVRPSGSGLDHRGVEAPSRAELHRLIHQEFLTYKEVADRYAVDLTAIPLWLDKHGIERQDARVSQFKGGPPSRDINVIADRYLGGDSASVIAKDLGYASKTSVLNMLRAAGIERRKEGWNQRRYTTDSGFEVRSIYEKRVADWLSDHDLLYEYEPSLPECRCRADFLSNGWYVEVWGVHSNERYRKQKQRKLEIYRSNGLSLIEILPHHFSKRQGHLFEQKMRPALESP